MKISKQTLLIILGTIIVYAFTRLPITLPYAFPVTILLFIIIILVVLYLKRKKSLQKNKKRLLYSLFIATLLLIGSTGWFFSPFFLLLYPTAILLSIWFSAKDTYAFAATIAGLFLVGIGEVDVIYDILAILSFLSVIPLVRYLNFQGISVI